MSDDPSTSPPSPNFPRLLSGRPWEKIISYFFVAFTIYFIVVCVVYWSYHEELIWSFSLLITIPLVVLCLYIFYPTFGNEVVFDYFTSCFSLLSWICGAMCSIVILYLFDQKFSSCKTKDHLRCQDESPRILVINVYLGFCMSIIFWVVHGLMFLDVILHECIYHD